MIVGDANTVVVADDHSSVSAGARPPRRLRPRRRPAGRKLPTARHALLGRDRELAQLSDWLDAGFAVQVTGEMSTGKSALLLEIAARRQAEGTSVVFLSAAGQEIEDVAQELFQACYDVQDYRPTHARLRELMSPIRALVVVDDFACGGEDLADLASLVPAAQLAVSTAQRLPWRRGRTIELGGLPEALAVRLAAEQLDPAPTPEELSLLADFCQAVQGHPGAMLQAGAALRSAHPEAVAGTGLDPHALSHALAAGLGGSTLDVLAALVAVDAVELPAALIPTMAGAGFAWSSVERLEAAGLAVEGVAGIRPVAPQAKLVVQAAGWATSPARYAAPLAPWARTATVAEIAEAAPVLVRVLEAAVADGQLAVARDLARATAPALCRALRWGSWRRVLALGRHAARALGATEDERYFAREENSRLKALGLGAAIGAAIGGSLVAGEHLGAATPKLGLGKGSGALLAKPAVLGACAALAVGGLVTAVGVVRANSGDPLQQSAESSPRAIVAPHAASPVAKPGQPANPIRPGDPGRPPNPGSPANPGNSRDPVTPDTAKRPDTPKGPDNTCVARPVKGYAFSSGSTETTQFRLISTFAVCDGDLDVAGMRIVTGADHFALGTETACPTPFTRGATCSVGIVFTLGSATDTDYDAEVDVPYSGQPGVAEKIPIHWRLSSPPPPPPSRLTLVLSGSGAIDVTIANVQLGQCGVDKAISITCGYPIHVGDQVTLTPHLRVTSWPEPCAAVQGTASCAFVFDGSASKISLQLAAS